MLGKLLLLFYFNFFGSFKAFVDFYEQVDQAFVLYGHFDSTLQTAYLNDRISMKNFD